MATDDGEHRGCVSAVEAIWNRGALEAADALFAPDYVNHGGLIPDLVRGPEAIKVGVALYRTAFPGPRGRRRPVAERGDGRAPLDGARRGPPARGLVPAATAGQGADGQHAQPAGRRPDRGELDPLGRAGSPASVGSCRAVGAG